MNPIHRTQEIGQSIWLDYIRRDIIESGELAQLIDQGVIRGVTSNPTIFENAISGSDLYTSDLRSMAHAGWTAEQIFDQLAISDIRGAADAFLPLYERTNGADGFVSIEVNPKLADKTQPTLDEARRLWSVVNRPNVMIKIPATEAGIPAIEESIYEGINVNVTLIFSLDRYAEVMDAYLKGLERRTAEGGSLDHIASVASFFVSRVDTAVDGLLEEIIRAEGPNADRASALLGKAAIANVKLAYAQFEAIFGSDRFLNLKAKGARAQRPLWASTSTKNPAYPDTYYLDNLIGPFTVNTVPMNTIEAFMDHGVAESVLAENLSASRAQIGAIEAVGISMAAVTDQLEREGVSKFADSFKSLLSTLRKRSRAVQKELGPLQAGVEQDLSSLDRDEVGRRLWQEDTSLWTENKGAAEEVSQRLGWLTLPGQMAPDLADLIAFREEVLEAGITNAVLLGMGGSSLASDVFRRTLNKGDELEFYVLDSTDPAAIAAITRKAPVSSTLFIVGSKSGSTIEPLVLMEYFWARTKKRRGNRAGGHFIAITDPGSKLEQIAKERNFRRVFSSPSNVGGRYSALTHFGLVPAALMGIDVHALVSGGGSMARACGPNNEAPRNPGLHLGAVLGSAGLNHREKLTIVADKDLEPFADWIEQLVAESSGKEGKGLTPIVGEAPGSAKVYGEDRLMIYLREGGELDRKMRGWIRAGIPVAVIEMTTDAAGFGRAFFKWEVGTAVACHMIGVNAFDQPDVQSAKNRTGDLLAKYEKSGAIPQSNLLWEGDGWRLYGNKNPSGSDLVSAEDVIAGILDEAEAYGMLGILTYLRQDAPTSNKISKLRKSMRDRLGVATVSGFGPRYLHSTGQLYKGGPDQAVYLFITSAPKKDIEIPGKAYTFGALERAQAVGDIQALVETGRPAYRIELDSPDRLRDFLEVFHQVIERKSNN